MKPESTASATRAVSRLCTIAGWIAVGLFPAQQPGAENTRISPPDAAAFESAPMDLCADTDAGFLSGTLYGALSEQLEWRSTEMECGGMLRPNNAGIRLVFAVPRHDERLLIVFGIDGELDELATGEHATNITIVDETRNRFFSTGGQDRCWSTIESIQPVTDRILHIVGEVFCAGSLPSLSDNSSVALRGVRYAGRLLLDEPEQD